MNFLLSETSEDGRTESNNHVTTTPHTHATVTTLTSISTSSGDNKSHQQAHTHYNTTTTIVSNTHDHTQQSALLKHYSNNMPFPPMNPYESSTYPQHSTTYVV